MHDVWANLGFDDAAKVFAGDAKLANPVAALPSLHAAWPFMMLLFLWNRVGAVALGDRRVQRRRWSSCSCTAPSTT